MFFPVGIWRGHHDHWNNDCRTAPGKQLNDTQLASFKDSLIKLLKNKYKSHWYKEYPNRRSAYRCIRMNGTMDPIVAQAFNATGCSTNSLRALFPHEFTVWIDPEDVSYRIGENGSISLLYGTEYKEEQAVSVSTEVAPPTQTPAVMWQFNPQTVFCYAYAAPVLIEMDQLQSPSICYSDPRQMEPFNPQTALLPHELTLWNHQEHSEKYSEEDVFYYSYTAPSISYSAEPIHGIFIEYFWC
ncbi:Protein btg1 [Homalodisca vitripennis]|nr:Protein btg1 [Homalodisca vitripennis]